MLLQQLILHLPEDPCAHTEPGSAVLYITAQFREQKLPIAAVIKHCAREQAAPHAAVHGDNCKTQLSAQTNR